MRRPLINFTTISQYALMYALYKHGMEFPGQGMWRTNLAHKLEVSVQALDWSLRHLIANELVKRIQGPHTKIYFILTPRGEEQLEQLVAYIEDI